MNTTGMASPDDLARSGSLEELYAKLAPMQVGPGWAKPTPSLWPAPTPSFLPAHWSYAHAHGALEAAGRLINTELAERRMARVAFGAHRQEAAEQLGAATGRAGIDQPAQQGRAELRHRPRHLAQSAIGSPAMRGWCGGQNGLLCQGDGAWWAQNGCGAA